ncbi:hypothetical protein LTSEURB_6755, partial [Salmonella enterica subsp. enterica serovar Urbana str. R8-2977]
MHQAVVTAGDVALFIPVFTNKRRLKARLLDGDLFLMMKSW